MTTRHKSHTRPAKDDAREMDEEYQCSSSLWPLIRLRVPKALREQVDRVAALGGLSLHDIELMEYLAHEAAAERIKKLAKRRDTSVAISECLRQQVQSRKHLRTLRLAMSPIGTPNDMRHPEPEAEARKRAASEKLDAAAATAADPGTEPDLGDDLVN